MQLEITMSSHQQECLEFRNPTSELRDLIRETVLNNHMDSDSYKARQPSCPFLQCDCFDYLLIEFWGAKPEVYTEYLQRRINEEFGEDYVGTNTPGCP